MVVCITDQPRDKVAVFGSSVPIKLSRDLNLFVEFAGSHHRHGDGDAVVQRRSNPSVVATSRSSSDSDTLRINLCARQQIPECTLCLIFRDALLRNANKERFNPTVI